MARQQGTCEDLLEFISTPRWRSTIFWASISFAVCHFIAMSTMPMAYEATSDLNSDLLRQLIHFAAVFCRFTLPFGFVIGGLVGYHKIQRGRRLLNTTKANAFRRFRDR